MPAKKKPVKKTVKRSVKKVAKKSDVHFLGMLVLFAGFSMYAMASYFSSTTDYIENRYVSVLGGGQEVAVEVAPSCYTCPEPKSEFPACSSLWKSGVCPAQAEEIKEIFNDVDSTHPHAEAIEALANQGIVKGYADASFKPDNTINRAELLTIVTDALDADFTEGEFTNCFSDVGSEWFAVFVCYAKESGWVNGNPDGSYRPAEAVNKGAALKIVFESFSYPKCKDVENTGFTDVKASDWFAPYACQAVKDGIIQKSEAFDPNHQITRAEFVKIIYNVMKQQGLM